MLRKLTLIGIVALVAVGAGQANGGKELRISGPVVRSSANALSVENLVGDAVLTCAVPARLAEKAAALKPGDKIRMICIRYRGRKAELVKILRLGEKTNTRAEEKKRRGEEGRGEEGRREARGGEAVRGRQRCRARPRRDRRPAADKRLACRVPAEKQAKLEGLKVGDKVKIACVGNQLVGIERATAAKEPKEPGPGGPALRQDRRALPRGSDRAGRGRARSPACRRPRCSRRSWAGSRSATASR